MTYRGKLKDQDIDVWNLCDHLGFKDEHVDIDTTVSAEVEFTIDIFHRDWGIEIMSYIKRVTVNIQAEMHDLLEDKELDTKYVEVDTLLSPWDKWTIQDQMEIRNGTLQIQTLEINFKNKEITIY